MDLDLASDPAGFFFMIVEIAPTCSGFHLIYKNHGLYRDLCPDLDPTNI